MIGRTAALLATLALAACGGEPREEIWIYTSLYQEVIAEMEGPLQQAVPGVEIKWFQGGSENVASRLNAELAAGNPKADLILASDPFWYQELKQAGHLLAYDSPAAAGVPADLRDPDGAFTTARIPVVVIGCNAGALGGQPCPASWQELTDPRWKGKISMGSPLESGTAFTAVALLSRRLGWEFFTALRANEAVAAGGNSSVITRMETGERPVGAVLLENILKAQAKGSDSPLQAIYPTDGAVPVPSPAAILKGTAEPETARRVYDWFFSPAAQQAIIAGGMYSPLPGQPSPRGAKPWEELQGQLQPWSPTVLQEVFGQRDEIKAQFTRIVLD